THPGVSWRWMPHGVTAKSADIAATALRVLACRPIVTASPSRPQASFSSGVIVTRLASSTLASLLVASTLHAQTRTIAERLGHPPDAKPVILHADELGVAHSEDSASFEALNRGAINSASVMMPTPWVTEVAAYTKTHP